VRRPTYVNDAAQSSDRVGAEDGVAAAAGILHNGAGDHDDVLGRVGNLLDDKVDHLSETGIFVLEQLRDSEEKGRSFVGRELLAGVEQQSDLGQEDATSSRLDR